MNITIIGAGNTGLAAAAHLSSLGYPVTVYTRHAERAALWNAEGIEAAGKISGRFRFRAETELSAAAKAADLFLVTTLALAHRAVAEELRAHLRPGQTVLFYNGCWGALQALALFGDAAEGVTVGETANMPYIAALSADGRTVTVKGLKDSVSWAALGPAAETAGRFLTDVYHNAKREESLAATSLGSTNPIIHVACSLFNITRIDNAEDFLFFGTPLTRRTAAVMEKADAERLAVGAALGLSLPSLLDTLNSFWPEKKASLYEALTENPSYKVSKGPVSLAYRYLAEDLPCGIGPVMELGRALGVPTPATETLVRAALLYLGADYAPFLSEAELARAQTLSSAMPPTC